MADSNASLCQLQNEAPVTSTPYRPYASRTRLRHSVSFNGQSSAVGPHSFLSGCPFAYSVAASNRKS